MDKEKVTLKSSNPIITKLCGLPKIYKPGTDMRPIISSIREPNYNLAKFLTKKLNSFTKFQSLDLKNSIEKI